MPTSVDAKLFQTGYTGLSVANLEKYLGKSLTVKEIETAAGAITAAEYEMASRCNRNFDPDATYFETFEANFIEVQPTNTPLNTVTGIYLNGVDKTSEYTLGTHFWVYDNVIVFANPVVVSGLPYQAVKLEYTIRKFWGDDLVQLIKQKAAVEFLAAENGGVKVSRMSFATMSQDFNLSEFNDKWEKYIFSHTNFNI